MSTVAAEHMGAEQPGMLVKHVSLLGNVRRFAGGLIEQQIHRLSNYGELPEGEHPDPDVPLAEALPLPTYADAGVHFLKRINGFVFGNRERTASQEEEIPLEITTGT